MKKSVFRVLLTISLFFLCGIAEAITKNKKEYNLNGDIYCIGIKEYSFSIEFGELNRGALLNETYTYFLQNGNVYIDSLIDKKMYRRYDYDKHNNITQEMRILVGAGRKGKIGNTELNFNDTTDVYLYSNDYGVDGQIKEIKKFSKGGIQIQKISCSRTATGESFIYWNRRNLEKEIVITKTGKITKLYSEINDYKSPTHIIEETLNNKGLVIKKTEEALGGLGTSETLYSYDEHDNVITETIKVSTAFGGEKKAVKYRYEYDKNGNWTRKIVFKDGQVKSWIERVIFYASSSSDYKKIVEQNKQMTEKHIRIWNKERQYADSIAARKKFYADSIAARKKFYEDSLIAAIKKLDIIIEKELFQKHIKGKLNNSYSNTMIELKYYDIDDEIKTCSVNGNIISFTLKKGKTTIEANVLESRERNYYWSWDKSNQESKKFLIGYTNDFNDIIITLPFVALLHKEGNGYKVFTPSSAYFNFSEIYNLLTSLKKQNIYEIDRHLELFLNPSNGCVADQYKDLESDEDDLGSDNIEMADMKDSDNSEVFNACDEMPQFPGGPNAIFEYLSKSIRYPVSAAKNGIQGRVMCSLIIETDGSTSNIKVTRSVDPSLDKEAIRVIKSMPKWIPGKMNGTPVRVNYTIPVTFRLQ